MLTFLWAFLLLFAYNAAALTAIVLVLLLAGEGALGLVLAAPAPPPLPRRPRLDQRRLAPGQRRLGARGRPRARRHEEEQGPHQGEDVDGGGHILQAQHPLRGDRAGVPAAGGEGGPRRAERGGAGRDRGAVPRGAVRGGDVRAGGADGGLLRVQELPPREHRQEQPVGPPRGLLGGLRAAQGKGRAAGALLQRHHSLISPKPSQGLFRTRRRLAWIPTTGQP
ncbi:uncharacterized protein M6B38_201885 [Iris pallida]|uniref:Uncharacterized protein n=1 Tax=Iris pallida TaxID=29817 RepID=A0AAX6E9K9_IRIPA|nr:uncharacterized protein M6B38_201885 [Iris pallida]